MQDLQLERLAISDLVFDPQNARKHDEQNLAAIAGSLNKFGQRKPIVVTKDNVIVAGNGTATAALQLGWKDIAVVRVPKSWTKAEIKAFALADNRTAELAEWEPEILAAQLVELEASGIEVAEFGFANEHGGVEDFAEALDGLLTEKGEIEQITFTLHSWQAAKVREAIAVSKTLGEFGETGNPNSNGNALARIVELWLGNHDG
jgi:hypothetical protein